MIIFIGIVRLNLIIDEYMVFKRAQGYAVGIATDGDWDNQEYEEDVTGTMFDETAVKIRNFLKDKYKKWGVKYVLIIGDNEQIPAQTAYPSGSTGNFLKTDVFFSDLDGNWDLNGDGYPGDYNSDVGDNGVNFHDEVVIGRIPYIINDVDYYRTDSAELPESLEKILTRIMDYETDTENNNVPWTRSALLMGTVLSYTFDSTSGQYYGKKDGAKFYEYLGEYLRSFPFSLTCYTLYEAGNPDTGSPQSDYYPLADDAINNETALREMQNSYGLIFWHGHGGPQYVVRTLINASTDEEISEPLLSHYNVYDSSDCYGLQDIYNNISQHPPIVYAIACNNAKFSCNSDECILEHYLAHFAVGTLGYTKGSTSSNNWIDLTSGYSQTQAMLFIMFLIRDKEAIGDALSEAKYEYYSSYCNDTDALQNNYGLELFADPTMFYNTCPFFTASYTVHITGTTWITTLRDASETIKELKEGIYRRMADIFNTSLYADPVLTLIMDLNGDNMNEWIVFPCAKESGFAYVFAGPEENLEYIKTIQVKREEVDSYLDQISMMQKDKI